MNKSSKASSLLYQYSSVILFVLVIVVFSLLSPEFFSSRNLLNIVQQSASIGILAIGMTFVLLVAGIDLSVGSVMFLGACIAGKLIDGGIPLSLGLVLYAVIGMAIGFLNGFISTKFKIMAFIVTLAMLYAGRGLGLMITNTRATHLPDSVLKIGYGHALGIPIPVLIFIVVTLIAYIVLNLTPFGRHIYAVGNDATGAKKAGIPVNRILILVYVISGLTAAIGGIVAVAQLAVVAENFGDQREFTVIAATVLGGTSLFGGRGNVFPGTVIGTVLILSIENGLNIVNANPYIYPIITGAIIFLAVFIDSIRNNQLEKLASRRKIRVSQS